MDIQKIVAQSKEIALDDPPAGGSEYTGAVLEIFKANPGKKFCGREIKGLFADQGVELKNPSNILFSLMKQGKLQRPTIGWYTLG